MNDRQHRQDKGAPRRQGPFREWLTGSACRPHPMDATVPLSVRFAGSTVLLLMTSRERAATVRVSFSSGGVVTLQGARQIAQRGKGELTSVLRSEARACGASWVVISLGSGWQASYANRTQRAEQEQGLGCGPSMLLREDPGLFVEKPSGDCLYGAVDHPILDRSVVFSVKRRELEVLTADVQEAGLGLAAVRVGVASLLEQWFAQEKARACLQDIVVSDGLGVLMIMVRQGDFCGPQEEPSSVPAAPRQSSNRPGDVVQDLQRVLRDRAGMPSVFIGPEELRPAASGDGAAVESGFRCADPTAAALSADVFHDFNPWLERRRPALSRRVRRWTLAAGAAGVLAWLGGLGAGLATWANRTETDGVRIHEQAGREQEGVAGRQVTACLAERSRALEHLAWLRTHPAAQRLLQSLLQSMPAGVALERLGTQMDEGGQQMALEFQLLGGEEAQVAAVRAVEQVLLGLGYRIGERASPSGAQRGTVHRWRLIIPPAFEEVRS